MIDLAQNGLSHKDVLRLLATPSGVGETRYILRVTRDNVKIADVSFSSADFECNYNNQVKYSGSFTIWDDGRINWQTDFLQLIMLVPVAGGDPLEFKFTPLKPVTVADEIGRSGMQRRVEAYDESVMLQENSLGDAVVIPAGTVYTAAVESLIARANFSRVSIAPTTKTLAIDRVFEAGDSIMTAGNELLGEINYRSLEMGRDGILTSYKYELPTAAAARISYKADGESVIMDGKSVERDSFRRPNRFIGYASNPEMETPLRYEYLNDNPASGTSTVAVGYIITAQPRQYDNVADLDALADNVRQWANEESQSYEHFKLKTAVMPHHEVREIVVVDSQGASGVYAETAWRISISDKSAVMEHELRRIYA